MPGRCGQLRLLLWKNTLLKTRHPLSTCFELLIPLIAISILIIIRSLVSIDDVELTIVQEPHTITRVEPYFLNSLSCGHLSSARYYRYLQIAFVADGPEADSEVVQGLMEDVRIRLQTIAEGMEYRNDCCIDSGVRDTRCTNDIILSFSVHCFHLAFVCILISCILLFLAYSGITPVPVPSIKPTSFPVTLPLSIHPNKHSRIITCRMDMLAWCMKVYIV